MSSGRLAAARAALAAALTPKVGAVYTTLPSRFTPPAVLLEPDDPYITTAGRPFRYGDLHQQVTVIVRPGDNVAQLRALESVVENALDAIHAAGNDWTVQSVSAPFDLQVGQAVYLAARLAVTLPTRITTD